MNDKKHRARKRFGQNFLQDTTIIERIVACICSDTASARQNGEHSHFVEIGPGLGALTGALIATLDAQPEHNDWHLSLVELDRDLADKLRRQYSKQPNITIIQQDALDFDFATLAVEHEHTQKGDQPQTLQLFGNLPYNISTPLIFHLLACHKRYTHDPTRPLFGSMIFMLQKEVVDRLCATPNSKAYGRISVMAQYHCNVEHLFDVPPQAFDPMPKVTSAMVRLTPRAPSTLIANSDTTLSKLVQLAFAQRRKTLSNNLKTVISADQLRELAIDPLRRAETLSLEEFVRLSNALTLDIPD